MIGLGAMGTALAKAQVDAGHEVTVWNRSPQRMTPLIELGARGAESVTVAVKTSPLIMVCIDNYTATNALLRPSIRGSPGAPTKEPLSYYPVPRHLQPSRSAR